MRSSGIAWQSTGHEKGRDTGSRVRGVDMAIFLVENDSMKGKRRMIFTWSKLVSVAGTILFTVYGFLIARQIGVHGWQITGLVAGLVLWAGAYNWDLERRLKKLESKVAEIDAARKSR
jgi:hypothetical protein